MLTQREINEYTVYSMDNGKTSLHLLIHPITGKFELIVSDCSVNNSFIASIGSMATVVDYNKSQVIIKHINEELNKGVTAARRCGFDLDGFDKLSSALAKVSPIQISNKNRLNDIISQFQDDNINK